VRTLFYIRLADIDDAGATVPFATAPLDSPRDLRTDRAPLKTIAERANGQPLVVFVPATDVQLASVQVPARQPAKVLQAAPYLLEDQLADDIENQHFALGPRQIDGSTPVAVVNSARIAGWMSKLSDAGFKPAAVVPDLLALPFEVRGGRWSALVADQQVIVRNGQWSGFTTSLVDLPMMLMLADPDRQHPVRMLMPGDQLADVTTIDWPLEPMPGDRTAVEALGRNYEADKAINLLQGRWQVKSDIGRHLRPWKAPVLAGLACLAIAVLVYGIDNWRLSKQLAAIEADNVARFRQLFPSETRIVDLSTQVNQQLMLMAGSGGAHDALGLTAVAAQALQANPGLAIQTLQFRDGSLYLAMSGKDVQALEALRGWFAAQDQAALEVQSANSGPEGTQIRVRIGPAA